jgi:hypothetical protein
MLRLLLKLFMFILIYRYYFFIIVLNFHFFYSILKALYFRHFLVLGKQIILSIFLKLTLLLARFCFTPHILIFFAQFILVIFIIFNNHFSLFRLNLLLILILIAISSLQILFFQRFCCFLS